MHKNAKWPVRAVWCVPRCKMSIVLVCAQMKNVICFKRGIPGADPGTARPIHAKSCAVRAVWCVPTCKMSFVLVCAQMKNVVCFKRGIPGADSGRFGPLVRGCLCVDVCSWIWFSKKKHTTGKIRCCLKKKTLC